MRKTSHRHPKKAFRAGLAVALGLAMLGVVIPAEVAGAASPYLTWTSSVPPVPTVVGNTATWPLPTAIEVDGSEVESASVTCSPASGSTFGLGSTLVTCTAIDAANDDTPPLTPIGTQFYVTVDTDLTISAGVNPASVPAFSPIGATVNFTVPTASDEDGAVPVVCTDPSSAVRHPGDTFSLGSTTLTCTATDNDDSPSSVSTTVAVTVTPTKPGAPAIGTATAGDGSAFGELHAGPFGLE